MSDHVPHAVCKVHVSNSVTKWKQPWDYLNRPEKKSRVITVYIHCSTFQISNAVFATLPHWLSVVHIETDGNLAPFVHNPSNVSWASRRCLHWLHNSTHFWSEEFYCQKLSPHTGRPHGPDDSKTLTFTSYFQDRDLTTMRTTVLMNSPCANQYLYMYLHHICTGGEEDWSRGRSANSILLRTRSIGTRNIRWCFAGLIGNSRQC